MGIRFESCCWEWIGCGVRMPVCLCVNVLCDGYDACGMFAVEKLKHHNGAVLPGASEWSGVTPLHPSCCVTTAAAPHSCHFLLYTYIWRNVLL